MYIYIYISVTGLSVQTFSYLIRLIKINFINWLNKLTKQTLFFCLLIHLCLLKTQIHVPLGTFVPSVRKAVHKESTCNISISLKKYVGTCASTLFIMSS